MLFSTPGRTADNAEFCSLLIRLAYVTPVEIRDSLFGTLEEIAKVCRTTVHEFLTLARSLLILTVCEDVARPKTEGGYEAVSFT